MQAVRQFDQRISGREPKCLTALGEYLQPLLPPDPRMVT
jgi:hypothetical protein